MKSFKVKDEVVQNSFGERIQYDFIVEVDRLHPILPSSSLWTCGGVVAESQWSKGGVIATHSYLCNLRPKASVVCPKASDAHHKPSDAHPKASDDKLKSYRNSCHNA